MEIVIDKVVKSIDNIDKNINIQYNYFVIKCRLPIDVGTLY